MLSFTILKGEIVLDPNIILFKEFSDLYALPKGKKLLQVIYHRHSRDKENPFKDLDERVKDENIFMAIFNKKDQKSLKLTAKETNLLNAAEKVFLRYNSTAESRLLASMNTKLDQISEMLDDTDPIIDQTITNSGETKFNTNLTIMLNLFSKIESIMKSKTILQNAILKQESEGKIRGGGTTSFREMGVLSK